MGDDMSEHAHAKQAHDGHDDDGHGDHGHHRDYMKIYWILLVLLAISIVGPFAEITIITMITAFGVAFVKAYLVAKNFMHLDVEKPIIWYSLATALVFMVLMFAGLSPDVMNHEGSRWVNVAAKAEVERGLAAGSGHHDDDHGDGEHAEEHGKEKKKEGADQHH